MTAPDRLSLIESRWHMQVVCSDEDVAWLIAEVERLRAAIRKHLEPHPAANGVSWACCDPELMEALNSGRGVYQP